ncbi:hypothetical protein [Alkalihalobacterium alkalinitrilicum]|uniref:hypothetical protein n=1 Tax=Alkalihalobacterium alkalinitrilicum TaxID=427920 RepID=UPI000995704F|nr:hypothetical protein [Alkalihalobacterium alkalinitrilicum]
MVYRIKGGFIILLFLVISGCSSIDERGIFYQLNEIFATSSKLFQNHSPYGELFYNEQFHKVEDIERLLDGKVTENGLQYMVERIFDDNDEMLVYKEPFQMYIKESNVYQSTINVTNGYYETVRETILNPGLRLISQEELLFEEYGDRLTVTGENINIEFYNLEEYGTADQYTRYGYPANDVLTVCFTFVKDSSGYLLDSFQIGKGDVAS